MRIANPHLLWLLLATPAVVLAYAIAFARRRRLLNRLGQPALIARMADSASVPRKVLAAALVVLAVALLALAPGATPGGRTRASGETTRPRLGGGAGFLQVQLPRTSIPRDWNGQTRAGKADGQAGWRSHRAVAFAGETLTYLPPPTTPRSSSFCAT